MKIIHYTDRPIESLELRDYGQEQVAWHAKPNGLWFSVEGLIDDYNWKEWCESEKFRVECLVYPYEIILHEKAKILHLKNKEELIEFTQTYILKTGCLDAEFDTYQLKWDEVKKLYQGIIIAPYQWECRLALESSWYYGWDCASGCIWDIKCIESFNLYEENKRINL
jgi:hypothetical protein